MRLHTHTCNMLTSGIQHSSVFEIKLTRCSSSVTFDSISSFKDSLVYSTAVCHVHSLRCASAHNSPAGKMAACIENSLCSVHV